MGSFFYWLYAVGYKLFTSHPKGGLQGKWKTRNFRDIDFRYARRFSIHLEYPVFAENCGRLPVEYPENRLTQDAGTCRISWPPYLRDGKCWPYPDGRKPTEKLPRRIRLASTPILAILSRDSDRMSLQDQWHACCIILVEGQGQHRGIQRTTYN